MSYFKLIFLLLRAMWSILINLPITNCIKLEWRSSGLKNIEPYDRSKYSQIEYFDSSQCNGKNYMSNFERRKHLVP